jgi:hypothetical protein
MNLELIKSNRQTELETFISLVTVQLLSFDRELVPLPNSTGKLKWIPRCNKLEIEITNKSSEIIDNLLLTVFRTNSKIGEDNFDTVPIKTYNLQSNSKGKYEIIVFDPFNEKFEEIEVRISTKEDWEKRKKNKEWLNRASDFSKRIDIEN